MPIKKNGILKDLYAFAIDPSAAIGLSDGVGHFNVYRLQEILGYHPTPLSFNRRLYYKITLLFGRSRVYYADQVIEIDRQALVFTNPLIPYSWEVLDEQQSGWFCLFTESFFHAFGRLTDYAVFQPGGQHVYELGDEQALQFQRIYEQMRAEARSDFVYKNEVLKTFTHHLIQSALKLHPIVPAPHQGDHSAMRIYTLFTELLERQFPILQTQQVIEVRTAARYADLLNIHINHLNRVTKKIAGQTTTEIISGRLLKEAKILLRQTQWDVSEIAYCLGFEATSSFSRFFNKCLHISPARFRNTRVV